MLKKPVDFLSHSLLVIMLAWSFPMLAAPGKDPWPFWAEIQAPVLPPVDHSAWQQFLDGNLVVGEDGITRVRYGGVSAQHRQSLKGYIEYLSGLDPRSLSRDGQFAYWVNLYNALTVDLVLAHYPVKSIRKIGRGLFSFGPWDDPIVRIADQTLTLNDIEHRVLRVIWEEPRIHYVLNCASLGCPNLQPSAFTPENTETLLEHSAREFISHPRAQALTGGRLQLSSIYDWYAEDFGGEQGVLEHVAGYLTDPEASALKNYRGRIRYHYDWQLNDAGGRLR